MAKPQKIQSMTPYRIEPFGEVVIPKDWVFYTPLAGRLRAANNEEALCDLVNLISRVRRSRWARYQGIIGKPLTTNLAGVEKSLVGVHEK
jgi:hypothetical protein